MLPSYCDVSSFIYGVITGRGNCDGFKGTFRHADTEGELLIITFRCSKLLIPAAAVQTQERLRNIHSGHIDAWKDETDMRIQQVSN